LDASVVIPARNAAATLPLTLAALARQADPPEHELIVVDDGSTDATPEIALQAGAELLRTGGGEGPGAARNVGAARARGDVLVFVDADCEPEPDWLARLVAHARDADLVQGKVLPPDGMIAGPFDRQLAIVSEYGLYQTANLAIRRELFERIGGFAPIVMPRRSKELGEDSWLAWRARRAGARTRFADDAVVRHAVFPRGARGYVGEQLRVRFFPVLVQHMPELRDAFLYRRWFLSRRSAHFDVALVAAVAAVAVRNPLPALLAAPYAKTVWTDGGRWGWRNRPRVAAVQMCADVVRAGSLAWGSLRRRTPVV
jgi:glycosyltransferase involved in cell wall biosynthesis